MSSIYLRLNSFSSLELFMLKMNERGQTFEVQVFSPSGDLGALQGDIYEPAVLNLFIQQDINKNVYTFILRKAAIYSICKEKKICMIKVYTFLLKSFWIKRFNTAYSYMSLWRAPESPLGEKTWSLQIKYFIVW